MNRDGLVSKESCKGDPTQRNYDQEFRADLYGSVVG